MVGSLLAASAYRRAAGGDVTPRSKCAGRPLRLTFTLTGTLTSPFHCRATNRARPLSLAGAEPRPTPSPAGAEQRPTQPHAGGALLDRHLVVLGHAHRQLGQSEAAGQLPQPG